MKVCEEPSFLRTLYIVKISINIIKTLVPLLIIIFGTIDLYKAIINTEKNPPKDLVERFVKKIIAGLIIFVLPSLITYFINIASEAFGENELTFADCIKNANTETIKKIEEDQKCYFCSSTNAYRWYYKEPTQHCKAGWRINEGIDQKSCTYNITIPDVNKYNQTHPNNNNNKNNVVYSSSNIHFNYEYIDDGTHMPYGIFKPSTETTNKKRPLLIYLHGSGQVGSNQQAFINSNGPGVFNNWPLEGFDAYVLFPHLHGKWASNWHNQHVKDGLFELIDYVTKEYNIDSNKIVLSGASLGGIGAQYMGYYGLDRFSCIIVMSGYNPGIDPGELTRVPTIGIVGTPAYGEDSGSYNYMNSRFKSRVGEENLIILNTSHALVPQVAFTEDGDHDNKSDLIEWALNQ